MRKRIRFWIIFILCIITLSVITVPIRTRADFGNFAGNSDYGGGGGGGSSGGGRGFISSLESEVISWAIAIVLVILMILYFSIINPIVQFIKRKLGIKPKEDNTRSAPAEEEETALRPVSEYKTLDPGFSESSFKERLSNLYVKLQAAWHERDLESIRPYLTDAFYQQSDRQLSEIRKSGITPFVENIAVLQVRLSGFYEEAGLDHMKARLRTRIVNYEISDETGKVVSGSRTQEKIMEYEWDLCRKSGVRTEQLSAPKSVNCPQCGASLTINQTAECPYCGSIVTVVNEDWALDNIKGISQITKN